MTFVVLVAFSVLFAVFKRRRKIKMIEEACKSYSRDEGIVASQKNLSLFCERGGDGEPVGNGN